MYKTYLQESQKHIFVNKRVLLRLDLNVPIVDGKIIDATRIVRSFESLDYLLSCEGAKVIIISHLGRPSKDDILTDKELFSLQVVCDEFRKYGYNINFVDSDITTASCLKAIDKAFESTDLIMLENIRFYSEEERNDRDFARKISGFGEIYVNDAFSVSHRKHSSIDAINEFFTHKYFGFNFMHEIFVLDNVLNNNLIDSKSAAIIAGKKVSTKFDVLRVLADRIDYIIIGGAMANTFLHAQGYDMGASYVEHSVVDEVRKFLNLECKAQIILPVDFAISDGVAHSDEILVKSLNELQPEDVVFDLGFESVKQICNILCDVKLLIWNGPLGYYEDPRFAHATEGVGRFVADATMNGKLESIAGGGDIVAALKSLNLLEQFSYVSTGGGAFLEYIARAEF